MEVSLNCKKIPLVFFSFLLLLLSCDLHAGRICSTPTYSYTCKASDLNGTTSPPCGCTITPRGPKLCPRLESVQMPCLQRLDTSVCTYQGAEYCYDEPVPTPTPTPGPICVKPKLCERTDMICTGYEQKTCTRTITEQGACLVYSEGGVCLQYASTTRTEEYACNGACLGERPVTYTYVCGCDEYK